MFPLFSILWTRSWVDCQSKQSAECLGQLCVLNTKNQTITKLWAQQKKWSGHGRTGRTADYGLVWRRCYKRQNQTTKTTKYTYAQTIIDTKRIYTKISTTSPLVYTNMGWLGDSSQRGQVRQAWTAVGLQPHYPPPQRSTNGRNNKYYVSYKTVNHWGSLSAYHFTEHRISSVYQPMADFPNHYITDYNANTYLETERVSNINTQPNQKCQ